MVTFFPMPPKVYWSVDLFKKEQQQEQHQHCDDL